MRLCFTCGQEFPTWNALREHLGKAHGVLKYTHQNEGTVAFAIDSSGGITRFKRAKK